jgi:hypothetical protein
VRDALGASDTDASRARCRARMTARAASRAAYRSRTRTRRCRRCADVELVCGHTHTHTHTRTRTRTHTHTHTRTLSLSLSLSEIALVFLTISSRRSCEIDAPSAHRLHERSGGKKLINPPLSRTYLTEFVAIVAKTRYLRHSSRDMLRQARPCSPRPDARTTIRRSDRLDDP